MKTISVAVAEEDYEAFRRVANDQNVPIAQLIRNALSLYRQQALGKTARLTDLPVLVGHASLGPLPEREELYDEIFPE